MTQTFQQAITPSHARSDALCFSINDDWQQGRSCFGGLQVALALQAMRRLVPEQPLRVLQTTFVAPVPGGEVAVQAQVLRTGKNVTHAEARIASAGGTACHVLGIFGSARASAIQHLPVPAAPPAAANSLRAMPYVAGITPAFMQHFDLRWGAGDYPFSKSKLTATRIWLQHRNPAADAELNLVALADVIPSPALSQYLAPGPASSLTWTLELLEAPCAEAGHWRMDTELVAAQGGYAIQASTLHAPDNRIVALSRQTVVVFG